MTTRAEGHEDSDNNERPTHAPSLRRPFASRPRRRASKIATTATTRAMPLPATETLAGHRESTTHDQASDPAVPRRGPRNPPARSLPVGRHSLKYRPAAA